jgi:hypothetical protein
MRYLLILFLGASVVAQPFSVDDPAFVGAANRRVVAGITFLSASTNKSNEGVSSLTTPTAVPAGANFLLVAVQTRPSTVNFAGLTYNDIALVHVATESTTEGNTHEWWYLTAPTVGTHDLVATWSDVTQAATLAATVWSGVNQSAPLGTVHANIGSTATPTNWCASASGEVAVCSFGNSEAGESGAGETGIVDYGFIPGYPNIQMSYKAGTATTTFNRNGGSYWTSLAAALKPL